MKIVRPNHDVTPLAPEVEAAWKARADVFFAECRAAHDELVERNIAATLAREAEEAAANAPKPLLWAA